MKNNDTSQAENLELVLIKLIKNVMPAELQNIEIDLAQALEANTEVKSKTVVTRFLNSPERASIHSIKQIAILTRQEPNKIFEIFLQHSEKQV